MNFIKLPIYKWMLFYFAVVLVWLTLPNSNAIEEDVRAILLSFIFLFTMTALMYFDDEKMTMSRRAVLLVTVLAVFNNIYEFFNPLAFYELDSGYNILGRSAGFYINSNKAGEAIILGLIFSYSLVPNKLKAIFLIATFAGVLVTFSRAGISSWFIVVAILSLEKVIDKKNIFVVAAFFGAGLFVVIPVLIGYIESDLDTVASNLLNRLDFFASTQHSLDYSELERIAVAVSAFNTFADHPFLGGGIFLTYHWGFDVSTHNIYLKLMAEYGIIGFFIYPLLLLSSVWHIRGKEERKIANAFVVYLLVIGFTTHNILDAYHLLIAFGLMANLSYKNRKKLIPNGVAYDRV
ncbi:MAG: hypothetical protein BV458_10695 [Thermoplasmata archaeon M9B2D]|nr:MAG: hypothetical protein BV458_10695 [Thermoplasmata archaeon M9B2D]